ncbi:hypothetical protein ACFQXB_06150 [Plastorhodobacter daqingensis]|uniref:Uncharacterized protein n=1 Tax=Plastorhodobacter daqingensis TaxID=1387281 RepID=A0ABW2UKG9_9RHOB
MSDWSEVYGWNGGEMPVPGDTQVQVWMLGGDMQYAPAASFNWVHTGFAPDIVAFRAYASPVLTSVDIPLSVTKTSEDPETWLVNSLMINPNATLRVNLRNGEPSGGTLTFS